MIKALFGLNPWLIGVLLFTGFAAGFFVSDQISNARVYMARAEVAEAAKAAAERELEFAHAERRKAEAALEDAKKSQETAARLAAKMAREAKQTREQAALFKDRANALIEEYRVEAEAKRGCPCLWRDGDAQRLQREIPIVAPPDRPPVGQ